jgi:hypothetical protein
MALINNTVNSIRQRRSAVSRLEEECQIVPAMLVNAKKRIQATKARWLKVLICPRTTNKTKNTKYIEQVSAYEATSKSSAVNI